MQKIFEDLNHSTVE